MKHAVAAIMVAFALSGCVTTNEQMTPLQRIQSGVKAATFMTVAFDLIDHPQRLPAYQEARRGIAQLLVNEKVNLSEVLVYLRTALPTKEMQSEKATIIFSGIAIIFMDQIGAMELNNPEEIRAMATAMKEGLDRALLPYETQPNG